MTATFLGLNAIAVVLMFIGLVPRTEPRATQVAPTLTVEPPIQDLRQSDTITLRGIAPRNSLVVVGTLSRELQYAYVFSDTRYEIKVQVPELVSTLWVQARGFDKKRLGEQKVNVPRRLTTPVVDLAYYIEDL
ncbi:MAG TPA: hypothetical protein VH417_11410, partial [Vicinamibacterales bacterium]